MSDRQPITRETMARTRPPQVARDAGIASDALQIVERRLPEFRSDPPKSFIQALAEWEKKTLAKIDEITTPPPPRL